MSLYVCFVATVGQEKLTPKNEAVVDVAKLIMVKLSIFLLFMRIDLLIILRLYYE